MAAIALAAVGGYIGTQHAKRNAKRQGSRGSVGGSSERKGTSGVRRGGGKGLKQLLPLLLKVAGRKVLMLIALAVARTALSNRLARLQGYLFRAAFLRRVPLFLRNLVENIILCGVVAALESTSRSWLVGGWVGALVCLLPPNKRAPFRGSLHPTVLEIKRRGPFNVSCMQSYMELHWRRMLTANVHKEYFKDMVSCQCLTCMALSGSMLDTCRGEKNIRCSLGVYVYDSKPLPHPSILPFCSQTYYKMSYVDRRIENIEQRMCDDIPKLVSGLSELVGELISAVVDAGFYSWQLQSYTGTNRYTLAILAYVFGAGTFMTVAAPNVGGMTKKQQLLEGSYRQLHTRLTANAESVAFYGGIEKEGSLLQSRFKEVIKHHTKMLGRMWRFQMVQVRMKGSVKNCGCSL